MNDSLPNWLSRLLDLPASESGEGVVGHLQNDWTWAPWVTLIFVASCAAFIFYAYWTENGTARRRLRIALATVRLTLVGLVLLMIAQWFLARERTGLPYLVLVVDDSSSMSKVDRYSDEQLRSTWAKQLSSLGLEELNRLNLAKSVLLADDGALLHEVEQRFKLKVYFLSESAVPQLGDSAALLGSIRKVEARGGHTRLGLGLQKILDDLRGAVPAALVLFSDGINTDGPTLAEAAAQCRRKGVPLFTVGIGSDQAPKDLELSDLLVDEIAFVNDILTFEFKLTSNGFQGKDLEITLKDKPDGEVLTRKTVKAGADGHPERIRLPYRPTQVGDFEYTLEIAPLPEEANADNNRLRRTVSVRKEQIKVLLVQAYPSYEFRYVKNLLERDPNSISVKTVLQDADLDYVDTDKSALKVFPVRREELFQYDVILFGDVNATLLSQQTQNNLVDFVREKGGGMLFFAGPLYNPMSYRDTPLASLLPIELDAVKPISREISQGFILQPTELGLSSPQMQLGDTLAETAQIWQKLPEMYGFCETPHLRPGALVLAEHPLLQGDNGQKLPVFSMQYVGAGKVIFHATDDTWRWRLLVGDTFLSRYWIQSIRYLSRAKLLAKDRAAELTTDRREYQRGESVRFRVRFLDERAAPAADDGVSVVIEQQGQQNHRLTLRRNSTSRGVFEGLWSQPREGNYHAWLAEPASPGTAPAADFLVSSPPSESERLLMDATELKAAAEATKGRFYTMANVSRLRNDLPEGRQVPIESLPPISLWNRWPVLFLFLVLIAGEWIARKTHGML